MAAPTASPARSASFRSAVATTQIRGHTNVTLVLGSHAGGLGINGSDGRSLLSSRPEVACVPLVTPAKSMLALGISTLEAVALTDAFVYGCDESRSLKWLPRGHLCAMREHRGALRLEQFLSTAIQHSKTRCVLKCFIVEHEGAKSVHVRTRETLDDTFVSRTPPIGQLHEPYRIADPIRYKLNKIKFRRYETLFYENV